MPAERTVDDRHRGRARHRRPPQRCTWRASGTTWFSGTAATEASAHSVLADVRAAGVRALAVEADVGDADDVDRLFEAAAELGPVTGLVNNAGLTAHIGDLADTPVAVIREVVEVNLIGAVLCARAAAQVMSTARGGLGGAIVNVSSAAATLGSAHEYVHYAAAKAGGRGAHSGPRQGAGRPGGAGQRGRARAWCARASMPRRATPTDSSASSRAFRWVGSVSRPRWRRHRLAARPGGRLRHGREHPGRRRSVAGAHSAPGIRRTKRRCHGVSTACGW
jgi:hypothetical protein